MTLALNHAFLSDPRGFAQQHPLLVPTSTLAQLKPWRVLNFDSTDPSNHGDSKYESVASHHRVAFADINPGAHASRTAGTQVLDIFHTPAPGRFPVFWLPYAQNSTRKVTLKDKRPPFLIRQTGGEARAFFTSVLDGCSIFIEGSAEEPTVYHLNAAGFRVTSSSQQTLGDKALDRAGRSQETERRFSALPRPKSLRTGAQGGLPGARALHGEHYLPNHLFNPRLEQAEQNLNQAYVDEAAHLEQRPVDDFRKNPVHSALLFGWKSRDSGRWEFLLQTRARVDFTMGQGTSSRYVSSGLTHFWPGQFDQLVVRGRDTRDVCVKLMSTRTEQCRV